MGNVESCESGDHPEPEGTALGRREAGHRPRDFLSGSWYFLLGHKEIPLFGLKPVGLHELMADRWIAF